MVLSTQYETKTKIQALPGHIITFTGKVREGMSNKAMYINAETSEYINSKYKR